MANRRRNLFILVLVLAMLAASSWVISDKRTVLGLDLRGGTELVYQGRATPQVPEVTPEDIDRAIEIIRERVDTLGVAEPEITRIGADQIEVGLPDVQDSDRAIDRAETRARHFDRRDQGVDRGVQTEDDRPQLAHHALERFLDAA